MNHPRLLLFCCIASGVLAAVTLIPWGALEVFEFKTVDVRMWMRERFLSPAPRTAVQTYVLDDDALAAAARDGEPATRLHEALERVAAPARQGREVLGLELPTWHSVATPLLEQELRPWMGSAPSSSDRLVVGLRYGAQVFGRDSELPPLGVASLPQRPPRSRAGQADSATAVPATGLPAPDPALRGLHGARLGEIEFNGDRDGVVRRVPLVVERDGRFYPSFVLQVVCAHDGVRVEEAHIRLGEAIELRRGPAVVRRIPVDSEGQLIVNYRRRPAAAHQPVLVALERAANATHPAGPKAAGAGESVLPAAGVGRVSGVLPAAGDGPAPGAGPAAGAGPPGTSAAGAIAPGPAVVLLGTSARWVSEFHNVPAGGRVADIELAAEALQTILSGNYIHRVGRAAQYVLTWAILFLGSLAMVRLKSWRSVAFGFGLVAFYFVIEKIFFLVLDVWIDFVLPVIALTWATAVFPVYGFRWRMRRLLDEMRLLRRFDDLVLMNIAGGLVVADRHGMVIRHNPRAADLLARAGESLHGMHVRELFAVSPAMLELLGQVMGRGRPETTSTCKLPMATRVAVPGHEGAGDERVLELEVSLVDPELLKSPQHADLPCYVLTFDDVTEQVRRAHEDARRARLAAMGEIAAKLGHEIHNSLGALRLLVENIRDEIDARGPGARAIDTVRREIDSLFRRIDELRQYGRDPRLDLARCDLKELLEEALAFAGPKLGEKRIRAVLECEKGMPPVLVDRRQLREAFQNLIHNAIEAAPEGGRVSILAERTSSGNGTGPQTYQIHIEDNGPGIPAEIQDHVFALFFTTKPDVGTGLGLPIVKKIVESHGGRVSFTSGRDGGTTFTVTLPAPPAAEGKS